MSDDQGTPVATPSSPLSTPSVSTFFPLPRYNTKGNIDAAVVKVCNEFTNRLSSNPHNKSYYAALPSHLRTMVNAAKTIAEAEVRSNGNLPDFYDASKLAEYFDPSIVSTMRWEHRRPTEAEKDAILSNLLEAVRHQRFNWTIYTEHRMTEAESADRQIVCEKLISRSLFLAGLRVDLNHRAKNTELTVDEQKLVKKAAGLLRTYEWRDIMTRTGRSLDPMDIRGVSLGEAAIAWRAAQARSDALWGTLGNLSDE